MSNKFQKRVRARMKKTGESYQTAYQTLDRDRFPGILEFLAPRVTPLPVHRVVLKLLYGIPLDDVQTFPIGTPDLSDERRMVTEKEYVRLLHESGRCNIPDVEGGRERGRLVLCAGRQGGKSLLEGFILTYELWRTLQRLPRSSHPQRVSMSVVGTNRAQAHVVREGAFRVFNLYPEIRDREESLSLERCVYRTEESAPNVHVRFQGSDPRGLRGSANLLVVLDEFAHFRNPGQTLNAVIPSLAWGESHKLVVGSTPNGFNEFHSLYRDAWGRPDEAVALQLPTWEANLYIRPELLREEKRRDLRRFLQEYGAEFVEDDEP